MSLIFEINILSTLWFTLIFLMSLAPIFCAKEFMLSYIVRIEEIAGKRKGRGIER